MVPMGAFHLVRYSYGLVVKLLFYENPPINLILESTYEFQATNIKS